MTDGFDVKTLSFLLFVQYYYELCLYDFTVKEIYEYKSHWNQIYIYFFIKIKILD